MSDINERLERMETKIDGIKDDVAVVREKTAKLEGRASVFGMLGGLITSFFLKQLWH